MTVPKLTPTGSLIIFPEVAVPGTPASGYGNLYLGTDGTMYLKNDGGAVIPLGGGGSSGITGIAITTNASWLSVSGSPLFSAGTIQVNAIGTFGANQVLATPIGGTGAPQVRPLVAADIPVLDTSKLTTGVLPAARGGTDNGSYATGDLLYASAPTALSRLALGTNRYFLHSNGTLPAYGTLVDADLPAVAGVAGSYTSMNATVDAYGRVITAANGSSGTVVVGTNHGRLSLSSSLAVSTSDLNNQTTLYFLPFNGSQIALYNGSSAWTYFTIGSSGASITNAGLSVDTNYDVFIYDSSGLTLELVAWTDATTRATALVLQDGVYVKSGTTTKRYLGTIRTVDDGGTAKFADTLAKRFTWNVQNRVMRPMQVLSATASWSYSTATWRAANADNALRLQYVVGLSEIPVFASVGCSIYPAGSNAGSVGVGIDSTSANSAQKFGEAFGVAIIFTVAEYRGFPGIGFHYLQWLEYVRAGTVGFYGDTSTFYNQSSITGEIAA